MPNKILVAVDSSAVSQLTARWALLNFAREHDTVYLVGVTPPMAISMGANPAPIASAGAVAALAVNWEQQRKQEEELCRDMLHKLVKTLPEERSTALDLHLHVLPAAGGASGVAESIVAFAKERRPTVVVVGSRGMGSVKSTLMSLVGLGSVSGYLVHHLVDSPVAVCRGRLQDGEPSPKGRRKVMVSLDDSEASKQALEWVVAHALGPEDELHLVSVALPIPYPVSAFTDNHLPQPDVQGWQWRRAAALRQAEAVARRALQGAVAAATAGDAPAAAPQVSPGEDFTAPPMPLEEWQDVYSDSLQATRATCAAAVAHATGPLQIVADDAAASAVLEEDEFDAATQDSVHYARQILTKAVDSAASKVDSSRVFFKALAPEGGASGKLLPLGAAAGGDVGQSVVHYARENGVDLVVVGARGMGSWKRAIMSFVGLGSVSDYVVHQVECPVVVIKHQAA